MKSGYESLTWLNDKNGKEYVIYLDEQNKTPAPWINVIANDNYGFHISETGAGYTWSVNSHENKITYLTNILLSRWTDRHCSRVVFPNGCSLGKPGATCEEGRSL